ncbi:MAG: DUF4294 domain-containing protein [Candidatus Symbiothrix sp.]|jgi:hypothetical protein|nr:DUF4294 domain-containing protein [Candidatus Symbiothrix sp.]
MKQHLFPIVLIFCTACLKVAAQNDFKQNIPPFSIENGDTVKVYVMDDIPIYPERFYTMLQEDAKYRKTVRDVKKTLPYAKLIYRTLIETYEYIMTFPTEEERQAHLKRMEKDLFAEYKPVLKKMSLSQGKLLIRLIDRECNQSSYDLLKAFLGPLRAGFWNFFAGLLGASLKTQWDENGRDADTEKIVVMVEQGLI